MKTGIHEPLNTFVDFIYALVFAFIVQQAFDEIIDKAEISMLTFSQIILLAGIFYFLAWDWILARLLTIRNPYLSYSRFFCELLNAVFAYGMASAVIKGRQRMLFYLAAVLFSGGFWATRTQRQLRERRDNQELCVIQSVQYSAAGFAMALFLLWHFYAKASVNTCLQLSLVVALWVIIAVYEMMVPRYRGITAGPGVPFINRPYTLRIKRWLKSQLLPSLKN